MNVILTIIFFFLTLITNGWATEMDMKNYINVREIYKPH